VSRAAVSPSAVSFGHRRRILIDHRFSDVTFAQRRDALILAMCGTLALSVAVGTPFGALAPLAPAAA